ncbi:MAG: hypothetical protein NVS9B12_13810 [Vulcanimicrobiaceae bacterium]
MSVDQITFKTNAWKSSGMVAGYANNVADKSGSNLLKNRVETQLFQKFVRGKDVLDVGIGTGRASIPLAQLGYNVTGIDSSQAMLLKCRELAGSTAMNLIVGDLAALPVGGEEFDTVMALNTIAHFPHWQAILKEWTRVVRPGGRMVFDIFSLDHDTGYARAVGETAQWGVERFAPANVESYYLRLAVNEFVGALDPLGLSLERIVPYSVFFGTKGFNRFFEGTLLSGFGWDRLLSWVSGDERLLNFFLLLEEELVANLTTLAGCRFMAVLDKNSNPKKNAAWIENNAAYNAALTKGLSLATVGTFSQLDTTGFKKRLNAALEYAPNRFALARMLLAGLKWNWPVDLGEFLDEPYRTDLAAVLERGRLDADVVNMLTGMHRHASTNADFTYRGVPLGPAIEYNAMIAVLDKAFQAFEGPFGAPLQDGP